VTRPSAPSLKSSCSERRDKKSLGRLVAHATDIQPDRHDRSQNLDFSAELLVGRYCHMVPDRDIRPIETVFNVKHPPASLIDERNSHYGPLG
jgi:hypothetical protein